MGTGPGVKSRRGSISVEATGRWVGCCRRGVVRWGRQDWSWRQLGRWRPMVVPMREWDLCAMWLLELGSEEATKLRWPEAPGW